MVNHVALEFLLQMKIVLLVNVAVIVPTIELLTIVFVVDALHMLVPVVCNLYVIWEKNTRVKNGTTVLKLVTSTENAREGDNRVG